MTLSKSGKTKLCTGCGRQRAIRFFYLRSDAEGQYRNPCKDCTIRKQTEYLRRKAEDDTQIGARYGAGEEGP